MIRGLVHLGLLLAPAAVAADTVVAARTIPAQSVIEATDLAFSRTETPGAASDPAALIGQEARVSLYAGRPIRPGDVGPPAIVDRNQIVPLVYQAGGLVITAEGRALGRGAVGEVIRVMNISSRNTVMAHLAENGTAYVGGLPQ